MKINLYAARPGDLGGFVIEAAVQNVDRLGEEFDPEYLKDTIYYLTEDDGSALDLDHYHGWINPGGENWLEWIPGVSMWKLRRNSDGSRILSLKRQTGQELSIGMDDAELRTLHRLLETEILKSFNS